MSVHKAAILALVALCACGPKRAREIDPDARAKIEGTGLAARDFRAVAADLSTEMLASPAITNAAEPPRIAVLPVKNRSRFLVDQEILNTLLTDRLISQGQGKVRVLNRQLSQQIADERAAKESGKLEGEAANKPLGADFFLEGEVRGLAEATSSKQADYVLVRFMLTDADTSEAVWSGSYEVKKEGSVGVLYQ